MALVVEGRGHDAGCPTILALPLATITMILVDS